MYIRANFEADLGADIKGSSCLTEEPRRTTCCTTKQLSQGWEVMVRGSLACLARQQGSLVCLARQRDSLACSDRQMDSLVCLARQQREEKEKEGYSCDADPRVPSLRPSVLTMSAFVAASISARAISRTGLTLGANPHFKDKGRMC